MIEFKPSQIRIDAIPFVAAFGKSEAEHAAACLVRALQVKGDTWRPIPMAEVADVIESDVKEKKEPLYSLSRNPFFNPSPAKLVGLGFANWVKANPEAPTEIEFTDKGLEKLARFKEA